MGLNQRIFNFLQITIGFLGEAAVGNIAYAKANNIDGTKSFPEFRQYMIDEFGLDEDAGSETYKTVSTKSMQSKQLSTSLIVKIK